MNPSVAASTGQQVDRVRLQASLLLAAATLALVGERLLLSWWTLSEMSGIPFAWQALVPLALGPALVGIVIGGQLANIEADWPRTMSGVAAALLAGHAAVNDAALLAVAGAVVGWTWRKWVAWPLIALAVALASWSGQRFIVTSLDSNAPTNLFTDLPTLLAASNLVLGALAGRAAQRLEDQALQLQISMCEVELRSTLSVGEAASVERTRVGMYLHDEIRHHLAVASVNLEQARLDAPEIQQLKAVRQGLEGVSRALDALLSGALKPLATLAMLLEELPTLFKSPRVLVTAEALADISDARDFELLEPLLVHTVQELVTNALRHAFATEICIELKCSTKEVVLIVRDDGCYCGGTVSGGGVAGIKARVRDAGGDVRFCVRSPHGLEANVRLPRPFLPPHA